MNGNLWSNKNENSQGKNKGVKRRDRKMQRDGEWEGEREKTSGQWLCGLNLWCRMTTHTIHTHAHGRTHKQIHRVCLWLFFYGAEILKLFNHRCAVIASTNHYWTIADQLLTDLFIASPCSLVVLCNSPNKAQMLEAGRPWRKKCFVTPENNLFDAVKHHIFGLFPPKFLRRLQGLPSVERIVIQMLFALQ